jgi:transposase
MQSFYLGSDVSKGYADFVILDSRKQQVMKNFQLDDTFEGQCHLYDILSQFLPGHSGATLFAAVESTGGYENNWYNAFVKFQSTLNIQTARLNPLGVMYNSKADLKRNNTDKISAQSIAEYLITHTEKVTYQQRDQMASLRKQWGFIKMLTKQSTQLLNQLESLLYTANTELLAYCKDGTPAWVLKLLLKYPTAAKLARARIPAVSQIPYVTSERAQELVISAKRSVASDSDQITEKLVTATAKQILHLKKIINEQAELMVKECSIPEVDILKTFTGISDSSAIGLILEIQAIERFKTVKKLASFFGIHPIYKTSGDGSSGFHMSKKGRKEPRQILFMTALTAIRSNPLIRNIYLERTEKGMEKMAAIGLCMHKILRIIYGMLKHGKPFDPQIDLNNRQRSIKKKPAGQRDKSRRFQDYDLNAPISRRQNKKRLERKQSHSVNNTKFGINAPAPELVS